MPKFNIGDTVLAITTDGKIVGALGRIVGFTTSNHNVWYVVAWDGDLTTEITEDQLKLCVDLRSVVMRAEES